MSLSSDLISQFVQVTNDTSKKKKETATYGVVEKEQDGVIYVKLDGATESTPATSTVDAEPGDRVMVTIRNHAAYITGNIEARAPRGDTISAKISEFEQVVADKVSTEELAVERGRIDDLTVDNANIKDTLQASTAAIDELKADNVKINETLVANDADIDNLKTDKLDASVAEVTYATIKDLEATDVKVNNLDATYADFNKATASEFAAVNASIKELDSKKLSATDIEGKFANIDFSNIEKAAIEHFYSTSGLIEDVVVGDGTITGKLVGVTISGDLIEGNTVVAEKLVIKGEDGLYYKLNTDGVSTEAEQTDYNSLNGSIIRAKSVTAEKISVSDLVAFDATIGGFNITDNAIYSGAKSSADNSTRGLYMDSDGQLSIGDVSNHIKYYKDSSGNYKLEISVGQKNIETAITDIQSQVDTSYEAAKEAYDKATSVETRVINAETKIDQNSEAITLRATKTEVTTAIDNVNAAVNNAQTTADTALLDAANAQYDIDSLAIGGRNFISASKFNTSFGVISTKEFQLSGYAMSVIDYPKFAGVLEPSTEYTMHCDLEVVSLNNGVTVSAGLVGFRMYSYTSGTLMHGMETYASANWKVGTKTHLQQTFVAHAEINNARLLFYGTNMKREDGTNTNMTFKVTNFKIEKGNKETDWTAAPEDIDSAIESAQTTADTAIVDAANAQYDIDNLEIGGRNLLIYKDMIYHSTNSAAAFNANAKDGTITCTNFDWYFAIRNVKFEPGETYTISVKSVVNNASSDSPYHNAILVRPLAWLTNGSDHLLASGYLKSGGSITFSIQEVFPADVERFALTFYCAWGNAVTNTTITGLKIEKGNRATDWTPAPEDVDSAIDSAQTTADNASAVANDAEARVTTAEALIEVLSESISMLVTDANGASLMTQTENGWTFSTAEIQSQINSTSEALNDLTHEVGDVNSTVSVLEQAVADLGEIAEYVKIGTYEDEPCIELGEGDSEFKLRITNTRMIFTEGSTVLAYFNNQSLHIKKAVVEEELQQGGFVWKARSNGNLGLVWKGVTNTLKHFTVLDYLPYVNGLTTRETIHTFVYEDGMTWREFISSKYNIGSRIFYANPAIAFRSDYTDENGYNTYGLEDLNGNAMSDGHMDLPIEAGQYTYDETSTGW